MRLVAVPAALLMLVMVMFVSTGCAGPRPIESVRRDAEWNYDRGDYAAAARHYQEIADRAPGDWRAQARLGRCLLELDRPDGARRALEIAVNLRPADDDLAELLAEAMFREGAHNELFAYLRGRADRTRDTRAYLNLARYAMRSNDMDSASVALMTAIEVDEGRTVEPYLSRAAFAAAIGDEQEVIRRLRQAYSIDPDDRRVIEKLREYNQVLGPTLGLEPGR